MAIQRRWVILWGAGAAMLGAAFWVFAVAYPPSSHSQSTSAAPAVPGSNYGKYAGMRPAEIVSAGKALVSHWPKDVNAALPLSDDDIGALQEALMDLAQTPPATADEANALFDQILALRKIRLTAKVTSDFQSRADYAATLENRYLKNGMDFTVRANGDKKTTLTLSYVLMSRPTVYNLVNDLVFIPSLADLGFKIVVFTDGYNSTWRYNIDEKRFD